MIFDVRHLGTAARWPVGVLATGWDYMWRTTPMHRRQLEGRWPQDGPPEAPERLMEGAQRPEDGVGPLLRRRYRGRIRQTPMSASELMARLQADPDQVAPGGLARFHKETGDEGALRAGDEFLVRMPGPWNGPVRVVDVTPTSFRFATLQDHLEAGQIEWRARDEDGRLAFEIESWARAGDRLSAFLHDGVPMAKEVQLHMWTSVVENVVTLAGGRHDGGIDIETRRAELRR
jgi:hypothetical protein